MLNRKKTALKENLPVPLPLADVSRNEYDIQLVLDPKSKAIEGSVKINLTNNSDTVWTELCFRDYIAAMGQTFDQMSGSNNQLRSEFTRIFDIKTHEELNYVRGEDQSVLFISLDSPLEPQQSMQIQFEYQASIPENAFRYRCTKGEKDSLLFELGNFYPVLAMYENNEWVQDPFFYEGECFYSPCADYSITITLPQEYTVVCSGTESPAEQENGMSTWTIEAKNMRDVGLTASNHFAMLESSVNEVGVRVYYFNNDNAKKQAEIMLETAVKSMEFYNQNLGGYPYPNLDVVMTDDLIGAIEFPGYVRVGDYSASLEGQDGEYMKSLVVENTAHEVAHQWFYAVVGNNSYKEPWLDESFASFCQLAYQANGLSKKEFEKLVNETRLPQQSIKGSALNLSYGELGKNYLSTVYEKGKFFLYDLMNAMEEETFYTMLQEYYSTYAFQEVTTADFVAMVKKHVDSAHVNELLNANLKE